MGTQSAYPPTLWPLIRGTPVRRSHCFGGFEHSLLMDHGIRPSAPERGTTQGRG